MLPLSLLLVFNNTTDKINLTATDSGPHFIRQQGKFNKKVLPPFRKKSGLILIAF
jgi:hypothetical protein